MISQKTTGLWSPLTYALRQGSLTLCVRLARFYELTISVLWNKSESFWLCCDIFRKNLLVSLHHNDGNARQGWLKEQSWLLTNASETLTALVDNLICTIVIDKCKFRLLYQIILHAHFTYTCKKHTRNATTNLIQWL